MTRTLTRTTRVALNALTSYLRFAVALGVMFFMTPFVIRCVGQEDFGLWTLTFSALGLFAMLDFGFGTGVVKWVAESEGNRDVEYRNRMVSTAAVAYLAFACLAAVGVLGLSQGFNRLFAIPATQQDKALTLLWVLAARLVLLNLPLSLFRSVLFGAQRIYLINAVQASATLLYGLVAWAVLERGSGLIGLAWVNLASMLLEHCAYAFFTFRSVKGVHIAWSLADWRLLKEAAFFSGYVFVAHAAGLLFVRTDPMIIKISLPMSSVAVYAIALKIAEGANLLAKQCIDVLSPLAAELQGSDQSGKLRLLLVSGTKFALAPTMALAVAVWSYAPEAIGFWVGPAFGEAVPVLAVLMAVVVFAIPQMVSANVLAMTGHHRFVAGVAAGGAVLHVVLSLALVGPFGLIGVALGTLIAFVLINAFLTVVKGCRVYGVGYLDYARLAIVHAVLPATAQLVVNWGIKAWMPPNGLSAVGLQALAGAAVYGILFLRFFVTPGEKRLLAKRLTLWPRWRAGVLSNVEEARP